MVVTQKSRKGLNARGFSLIEVLVAAAIMGIVALGMATMFANMITQSRALNEKLAELETQRWATEALGNAKTCKDALTLPSAITFDSASIPTSIPLPAASISTAGGAVATVGQVASPTSPTLFVAAIDLANIQNAGAPDSWTGEVQIRFDDTKLVRSLRPASVRIGFETDPASPPNAKKIEACGLTGSGVNLDDCYHDELPVNKGQTLSSSCKPNYKYVFGVGVPYGSQDPVDSTHMWFTANSVTVMAVNDWWRIVWTCCRD